MAHYFEAPDQYFITLTHKVNIFTYYTMLIHLLTLNGKLSSIFGGFLFTKFLR